MRARTVWAADPDGDVDRTVALQIANWRLLADCEGVDPDIEYATARLARRHTEVSWAACRLLAATRDQHGDTAPAPDPFTTTLDIPLLHRLYMAPELAALCAATGHSTAAKVIVQVPGVRRAVYVRLAQHPDVFVRLALIEHGRLDTDLIRALATDPNPRVRRYLASRGGTPADVLDQLAADPDPQVADGVERYALLRATDQRPRPAT